MNDVVLAFGWRKVVEQGADGLPESIVSSCSGLPEQSLELGEELLDWVEIRGIGREVKHAGPDRPDRLLDPDDLVNSQVVHHHNVVWFQFRREHLRDVGAERLPGHGPIEHKRCKDPARPQARHNGRGFPVSRRHRIDQALAPGVPAVEAGHGRGRARLVDEDEAVRIHVALPHPPASAVAGHIGPVLLAGSQALFLCDRSSRCSMSAMVDSAFTTMPRTASAAWISRSVIPAWRDTMARSSSACFSSRGRREPPIFAGAVLPVRRTRCISLTAAEALTAKRRAACRIVLPPSTARTIRSRRSWDKGAVMISSTALTPRTWESDHLIPCKTKTLEGGDGHDTAGALLVSPMPPGSHCSDG